MCKNMSEFESLVKQIQQANENLKKKEAEIEKLKDELKSYMRKRQKTELEAREAGVVVTYKEVVSMRFNKEGFIAIHGEETYEKYCAPSACMKLNFTKPKRKAAV